MYSVRCRIRHLSRRRPYTATGRAKSNDKLKNQTLALPGKQNPHKNYNESLARGGLYILDRLRSAGLKLKPEKCCLFQKSNSFLGHTVSENGIGTGAKKTQAVSDWPTPRCLKNVRSFLGLTSYYRRFVQGYASIAAPLHALQKKNQRFTGLRRHIRPSMY